MPLKWWMAALLNWVLVMVVWIVIVKLGAPKHWSVPRDQGDEGVLTSSECDDHDWLIKNNMLLTAIRGEQCEAPNYDSDVLEFQNTWSNFAYIGAGLFVLYRRPRLLGIAVGINLCLLFLFSAWYHATLQPFTQSFDVGWIYAVILSLIVYAVASMLGRYANYELGKVVEIAAAAIPTTIGFMVSILKYNDSWHVDSTNLTIALLVVLFIPVLIVVTDRLWLAAFRGSSWADGIDRNLTGRERLGVPQRLEFLLFIGLPTVLCAVFKFNDFCGKSMCSPHATLQGHALWHVLGAVALAMTYDFFAESAVVEEAFLVL